MPLLDRLKNLFGIPTQATVTSQSLGLNEPSFAASNMTVDKIHSILRSAEAGQTDDLFALYRDIFAGHSHLQTEFNTRKLAVLGDTWTFQPLDPKNPADIQAADAAATLLKNGSFTNPGLNHLLNAALYPVSLIRKTYTLAPPNPLGLRYHLANLEPVNYHLLDYTDHGHLRLHNVDPTTGLRLTTTHPVTDRDYITHRGHLLTMLPDHWGGPLRAALFWWLFATQNRDWWVRFLDRFGAPFIVGKYNPADTKAKSTLATAFSAATRLFALVVSKETEIEVQTLSSTSQGDAFHLLHQIANRELSKLILGQTMTSEAQAQGLGGSQAQVHNMVRGDIKQFDATLLANTINDQLVRQFLDINGLTGSVTITTGGASTDEVASAIDLVHKASQSGLTLSEDGLAQFNRITGYPFIKTPTAPTLFNPTRDAFAAPPRPPRDVTPLPPYLPTNEQLDQIAAAGAPALAAAFTGSLAPLRRLIATSTSPADLETKIRQFYSDYTPTRQAQLIEDALVAYTANGTISFPH
jgi:phage gp29-like protein